MKVAVFDFDGTIIKEQSHQLYLDRILLSQGPFMAVLFKIYYKFFFPILNKHSTSKKSKELLLRHLKGKSVDYLEDFSFRFFEEEISPLILPKIENEIARLKKQGYYLVLVSGGFEIYLKYLRGHLGFDEILGTKLTFSKGRFIGRIDGEECLGTEKVVRFNQVLEKLGELNEHSCFFSDHKSDLPMFNLFANKYVVFHGQDVSWKHDEMELIHV